MPFFLHIALGIIAAMFIFGIIAAILEFISESENAQIFICIMILLGFMSFLKTLFC